MPITLTCPLCRSALRPREPLPRPGAEVPCPACGRRFRVRYGEEIAAWLDRTGVPVALGEAHGGLEVVRRGPPKAAPPPPPGELPPPRPVHRPAPDPDALPTQVSAPVRRGTRAPEGSTRREAATEPPPPSREAPRPAAAPRDEASSSRPERAPAKPPPAKPPPAPPAAAPRRRPFWRLLLGLPVAAAVAAGGGWMWLNATYATDLPSVESLQAYRPSTVTTVLDRNGALLGEIYEERRYVRSFDEIPPVVRDAFVAAEDAAFWEHDGMDWAGVARALVRNVLQGRVAQGGSTITQQVAKNFLLSSDRRIERKIKEMFLAWRIEEAYTKEHILYLYLNEIFLGAQSYGVEAAARTFFGKHVEELTLAEAAMIAGLPPRPSEWNPFSSFERAKERQAYVLDRMVATGAITREQAEAAKAEPIVLAPRDNAFRSVAPHFTEHVRRHLVDRYGEARVVKEGFQVVTTCDLELQRAAQAAVTENVTALDERMGFRRDAIEHLADDAAIEARRAEHERALRIATARREGPGGGRPLPERSAPVVGETVPGIVLEVHKTWARVAVGAHEGIVPLAWATWMYPPDPERSHLRRKQDDLGRRYDLDGDGEADDPILQRGDVLRVRIEALSTLDPAVADVFAGTPGADHALLALRPRQVPEVEAALLSFELSEDPAEAGAVRAMVGGADFDRSQLNRAVQSRRQVGSTFKPIVYAAALASRKLTAASIVPDAPIAIGSGDEVWKPENYGGDFRGNITLRQALVLSRNTSTVRVLDTVDPGMGRGVVYDFARRLGLGGLPPHLRPDDWKPGPDTDWLCPWVPKSPDRVCVDETTTASGPVCRACDLSIGLGSVALSVEEMARAYGILANGGRWVEPWYVVEVRDRDGEVIERHQPVEPVPVIEPAVAELATWMLEQVATVGTGADAYRELKVRVAGKTGTTNDEKDAWFVGYTPDVVTAVWVGFDQPRSLGVAATGGRVALPIWIRYMRTAIAGRGNRPFADGNLEWAEIDEATGHRVESGGRRYPFLEGTVPPSTGYSAGEATLDDLATEL